MLKKKPFCPILASNLPRMGVSKMAPHPKPKDACWEHPLQKKSTQKCTQIIIRVSGRLQQFSVK